MANLDDVARLAADLPEATEDDRRGQRAWSVAGKVFAWERRFSKADIRRYGDETPPDDPILGVKVEDLSEKEAVLASGHDGVFTIPHFDGYAAVLVELDAVDDAVLAELVVDAWLACAPPAIGQAYVEREQGAAGG